MLATAAISGSLLGSILAPPERSTASRIPRPRDRSGLTSGVSVTWPSAWSYAARLTIRCGRWHILPPAWRDDRAAEGDRLLSD